MAGRALGAAMGLLAGLALAGGTCLAQPATFAPIVKAQRSKVVHINTSTSAPGSEREDPLGPFRFPEPGAGTGSGFIISADGYIVTNYHVVSGASDIRVELEEGAVYPAEVVGLDAQTDLAVLKIEPEAPLPTARFGDSSRLEVGDWVLAIGNPLGLNASVTAGIISAKGRNIFAEENLAYGEFLQTDAAINPGNSGGPLFNLDGEVVGVNSAISRRGQGIGFAVPSNLAVRVVEQLRAHGRVIRGWLGVVIEPVTPERVDALGLPSGTEGVVVAEIIEGTPAAASALQAGDVLTHYDGEPLQRVNHLQKLVALTLPDTRVRVDTLRRDTQEATWRPVHVQVRIGRDPEEQAQAGTPTPLEAVGLSVTESSGSGDGEAGVRVESVRAGSKAEAAGLQPGDLILEVDREPVMDAGELRRILRRVGRSRVAVLVEREERVLYFVLPEG